jgi:hypothetical protein
MPVREAVVLSRTRAESGNPKEDEIADNDITQMVQDCLDKISESVSNWNIYSITTVKNQPDYSLASGIKDVLFCDWSGGSTLGDLFDTDFDVFIPGVTPGPYDVETGIYKEFVDALAKKKVRDTHDWMFRIQDNKLFLIPPPTTAGDKVWYIGVSRWTLDSLPDRFEKLMVWYCTAEALEFVARKRRRLTAVSHTGGMLPWSQADPTLQDAQKLRQRFNEYLSVESRKNMFP